MTAPTLAAPTPTQAPRSIVFPLVLIALGVALVLANAGYLTAIRWTDLFQLWPVLLVLAGVDILLRPRSFLAAAVVEIAIIVATIAYLVSGANVGPANANFETIVPRAAVTDANVSVSYGGGVFRLTGGGTDLVAVRSTAQDIERTVDQSGASATVAVSSSATAFFGYTGGDRRWEMTLPSDVRTGLTLSLGAGDFDVDLSSIRITRASISTGASDLTLRLPHPKGDVPITISGGMSSIQIEVPSGVEYRFEDTGALHSVTGVRQSSGYATATDRITIRLSAAMSSVVIR